MCVCAALEKTCIGVEKICSQARLMDQLHGHSQGQIFSETYMLVRPG